MSRHRRTSAIALERRLLHEVAATARQHEVPLIFLVAATAWELDRMSLQPFDERARLDAVASAIEDLHVPCIDARRVAPAIEHYLPNDGHFSAAGNTMVAEASALELTGLASEVALKHHQSSRPAHGSR